MSIQLPLPFPPEEVWKDIPGYEGLYQVSSIGQVRRLAKTWQRGRSPGLLKPQNCNGYRIVGIGYGNLYRHHFIHRLVMLSFVGECQPGMEVNHKNGIKHDNRLENLEYVTSAENKQHARTILGQSPIRNAKLTELQVREIRRLRAETGLSFKKIAESFNVSETAISLIISRKKWKHVE